jgi:hypothetical protein
MAQTVGKLTALKVSRSLDPGMYPDGAGLYLQVTGVAIAISGLARHRDPCQLAQSGECQGVLSQSQHSQGRPSRIQHQGQRLPIGSSRPISGSSPCDPVLRQPRRVRQD